MKKSNILILAISVLASAFLLYLWWVLGFNKIDNPLDLTVSIVWWVVIAALVAFITRWERKRRRAVRTMYLSPTALYNSEAGVVELEAASPVAAMEETLKNLAYGFKVQDLPDASEFDYRCVVKTDRYKPAADGAPDAQPQWEGSVIDLHSEGDDKEKSFSNRRELEQMLGLLA